SRDRGVYTFFFQCHAQKILIQTAQQSAARRLYGHVDNLELYPGLQAEATVPLGDRLRIACGYTVCD
ncbi:hypothetical protein H0H87_003884, partial [Tephrocybe sp. NHM501043]